MSGIPSPESFLNGYDSYKTEPLFKMGTIDPAYNTGRPKIIFDGESTPSVKQYPYLSTCTPVKNNRVLLIKVAGVYVVLGRIV